MKKSFSAAILFSLFILTAFGFQHSAIYADCEPCEAALPSPCGDDCGIICDNDCCTKYLTEKSIFESKAFNNTLIGKNSKSRITFYGWILTGITTNEYGATNEYDKYGNANGTHAYGYNIRPDRQGITDQSGNTSILMLEQPSGWKVNHLWVGAKRELTDKFDWGFQTDFIYGTDPRYARNWGDYSFDAKWGSGDYFASFAQLYGTIGTKRIFLKAGKFSGGFSYEGLAAPKEFFYSHANICYGRPFTTEGVILEWNPCKKLTVSGGWTAGVFQSMFDNPYEDSGFLGKATYRMTKNTSLTYKIFYNDKGQRPNVNNGAVDCLNTLIYTWNINKHWFYMGEIAFTENKTYTADSIKTGSAFGFNNHLIYTVNKKLSVGFRGEYNHNVRSFFDIPAVTGGSGGDLWDFTFAANYKINPKMTFRPEIRYDIADYRNGYRPFGGDESEKDQISGGVSFIVMF